MKPSYKNHRLYNEFVQLRYDDKDFAYMWKDRESDFFEWVFAYEIDSDWGITAWLNYIQWHYITKYGSM